MINQRLKYVLAWYKKEPEDAIVGSVDLDLTMKDLQQIYGLEEDMYVCYDVERKHVEELQKHTRHNIQLDKYDYFVEGQQRS